MAIAHQGETSVSRQAQADVRIRAVHIQNFRKLRSVRVELARATTILVGPNNSGKTTAMVALSRFLVDEKFSIRDFTLSHVAGINAIGKAWESSEDEGLDAWVPFLPSLDVWLDVEEGEVHHVTKLLPSLDWTGGLVGARFRLQPKDVASLRGAYLEERRRATEATGSGEGGTPSGPRLWPRHLVDFLGRRLSGAFGLQVYTLDPTKYEGGAQNVPADAAPVEGQPLRGLIRIDEIRAQRGLSDAAAEVGTETSRRDQKLSAQLRSYYEKHLDPESAPTAADLDALRAIHGAQSAFDERLKSGFQDALLELESLGYPGLTDPRIRISTKLRPMDGLRHESAVEYEVNSSLTGADQELLRLPESYNGLGFQNLVSIVFMLMGFRDEWMRVKKASSTGTARRVSEPIHLVLVEEPEAHLHAQVQQVFIRKAYEVLRRHPELEKTASFTTHLLISTHSGHIAIESEFDCIRYFRRRNIDSENQVPTTAVVGLSDVFGDGDENSRFARRYLRATHCDLLFADAAILVEGAAERILVPEFIRANVPELSERYITILDLGGSHAHRFRTFIGALGLTTLVVADIDAVDKSSRKSMQPAFGAGLVTANNVLKQWHPGRENIDDLAKLAREARVASSGGNMSVFVAYQQPIALTVGGQTEEVWPSTFEDAVVMENLDTVSGLAGGMLARKFKATLGSATSPTELAAALFTDLSSGAAKAEFALDLLCRPEGAAIQTPRYMAEGLSWLRDEIGRREVEEIVAVGEATMGAEA